MTTQTRTTSLTFKNTDVPVIHGPENRWFLPPTGKQISVKGMNRKELGKFHSIINQSVVSILQKSANIIRIDPTITIFSTLPNMYECFNHQRVLALPFFASIQYHLHHKTKRHAAQLHRSFIRHGFKIPFRWNEHVP